MNTEFASTSKHVYKNGVVIYSKPKSKGNIFWIQMCFVKETLYDESNGYGILNSADEMAADVGDTNGF